MSQTPPDRDCLLCKEPKKAIYLDGLCFDCAMRSPADDPSLCLERPAYAPLPSRKEWLHSPSACQVGGCEECKTVSDR